MAKEDSSAETLMASSLLDQDRPLESRSASASSSSSSSPPSDPAPPISKSSSSTKLNAKAPEFVPRSNSGSSLTGASTTSTVTSPGSITAGSAPTLLHVYQTATRPAGAAMFSHVPVQGHYGVGAYHVPVQYNRQYYAGYVAADQQREFVAAAAGAAVVGTTTVDSDQGTGGGSVAGRSKNGPADDVFQKILNQVEYYFSDLNLATTDHLIRFMNKDPEGYVPISVVASFKKIKALISSNSQLADILRSSEKLVVSEDGKKVKRLHRLTESDMEDLQSRIVVAENLPEDHCHQTLMKIFSAVGSVKTIRTCQPQTSNGGASPASRGAKSDGMLFSSKLHAFVEYDNVELAEKAVAELNDENNWRNGLKVRLLLRPKAKSSQARVKRAGHENESSCKENDASSAEDSLQSDAHSNELAGEDDKEVQQKKTRNRGRGKGRGRPQYQPSNNRGGSITVSPATSNILANNEQPNSINKQSFVPRMPDGTRGFSMGRGKPVAIKIA